MGGREYLGGHGMHQLYFGKHPRALTLQQLAQIVFSNPAGLPPGNYPARMLTTGEVVPHAATLAMTRPSRSQLYLPSCVHTKVGY